VGEPPALAHCYAGCLSHTVRRLRDHGVKVTYTAAAHDKDESRKEYEKLGFRFDYPHLIKEDLWRHYLRGYLEADVLVVPSTHSESLMRKYGRTGRIEVIPHGVHVPEAPVRPLPLKFTVGYLGAVGPDKGLIYLLEAWGRLNYRDGLLKVAGRDSASNWVRSLVRMYGGNVQLCGWAENVGDFYNGLSVYVQPSVSEGFGIEVLEALAHGRPVVASKGAGASDCLSNVPRCDTFEPRAVDQLMACIQKQYNNYPPPEGALLACRERAQNYTWDKVRARYQTLWRGLGE